MLLLFGCDIVAISPRVNLSEYAVVCKILSFNLPLALKLELPMFDEIL